MNGLNVNELCSLFCCPPLPSRIAAKVAFLPPESTYSLRATSEATGSEDGANGTPTATPGADGDKHALENVRYQFLLSERADWMYTDKERDGLDVFFTRTSRGNRIACMYVKCAGEARYTLLFSHGNAVDLGQMSSFYMGLGARIGCNVFGYDYSGYGASDGRPSEKNVYADVQAAWHALRVRYSVPAERVILYGQSIGTVPTVDLSTRLSCAGVVLHSPLMSGMRVVSKTQRTWFFDSFPSIDKAPKIKSPVLVIHGIEDEVIDFSHGVAIHNKCPRTVEPLWVEGAGHNDIEVHSEYLERLKKFVTEDLN